MIVVITINMLGAGAYGEAEFCFAWVINQSYLLPLIEALASLIKVLTITGLIILGIIIDLGGGPDHDRIGFRYWKNPGAFAQFQGIPGSGGRFLGWWAVLNNAAFSFIGTEIVAVSRIPSSLPPVARAHFPRLQLVRQRTRVATFPKQFAGCIFVFSCSIFSAFS